MNTDRESVAREPVTFFDATDKMAAFLAQPEIQAAILAAQPKIEEEERRFEALAQLRKAAGYTQKDIAKELGVKQPAISELEGREDMLLSTLTRYLNTFKAHLEIVVEDDAGGSITVDARRLFDRENNRNDYTAIA